MPPDWIEAIGQQAAAGRRAVLVCIAHASGSVPRDAGTAMLVAADTVHGTIGGGHLEYEAIRLARATLAGTAPPPPWLVRFPLAARLGQCCGGLATLAFAVLDAPEWLAAGLACARADEPFALVTRIGPGGPAQAHRLVTTRAAVGSLGDAALDDEADGAARPRVSAGTAGAILLPSTHEGVTLLVHVRVPSAFDVFVFGNGHVGRALAQVLGTLSARVRWIDGREHDFPAQVPANVEIVVTDVPEAELAHAPRGASVLILTHSHALDYALVEQALDRDDWSYLGLIGSQPKRRQFEKRLAARGTPAAALARITCPIGASTGIRSKEPGAIAVAVAAELLARRERAAASAGSAGATAEACATSSSGRRSVP